LEELLSLPFALVILALAHFLDYATFMAMVGEHGLQAEANPIVVLLAERTGFLGLTVAKLAGVVFLASVVVIIVRSRKVLAGLVMAFGIGSGFVGAFSNLLSL
jgi:hypothetical protein